MSPDRPKLQLDPSERDALIFHAIFAVIAGGVLAMPVMTLGMRVWALVFVYNLGLPITAHFLGHRQWTGLWLFLVPLSALQVVPDWVLSAVLEVLVFPDIGGPRIDTVNASMAGMWTLALFPIVFIGLRVESRAGRYPALLAVAVASLTIFGGSEALVWRLPIWYAQNVTMIGHVALYVVIPEILLGLTTFRVYKATTERSLLVRLASTVGLMLLYLVALIVFYFLIEGLAG